MNELAHFRFCGWLWLAAWIAAVLDFAIDMADPMRRIRLNGADAAIVAFMTTVVLWLVWGSP